MKSHGWRVLLIGISCLFSMVAVMGCAHRARPEDPQAKNTDRGAILSVLDKYQESVNAYHWERLSLLFTPDGKIGETSPSQYIMENRQILDQYVADNCTFAFDEQNSIDISDRIATVIVGRTALCDWDYGSEYLVLKIELVKSGGKWFIKDFNSKDNADAKDALDLN